MTTQEQAFDEAKLEEFAGRLFGATVGAMELATIYVGVELGLYGKLAETGPITAFKLAKQTSLSERWLREWLTQQAVAGILDADTGDDAKRAYSISPEYTVALTDKSSPAYLGVVASFVKIVGGVLPSIVEAVRSGGGVPYSAYGIDGVLGQADFSRPAFVNSLVTDWVPQVPGLKEKLESGAKVADVACGVGVAPIELAKAFPNIHIDGYDLDEASIAIARKSAAEEGVADRVSFQVHDARDPKLTGAYDVVTVFEAIHDMGDPVAGLATLKRLLAPGGIALVADERAADEFTAPGDDIERALAAFSIVWCLPQGLADGPDAHGTLMRAPEFRAYAKKAGWKDAERLGIEHPMLQFYRLVP